MRNLMSKIAVPALLVMTAAVQSFGLDVSRVHGFPYYTDSLDVRGTADTSVLHADTTALKDSIPAEDGEATPLLPEDAEPAILPRDTIVVPDSLRYTDTLRYKYYIALKDSLLRFEIRDSLIQAGDSLELHLLDSLYIKDSTDVAQEAFRKWYGSLGRKERKRYDYEQELPLKIAASNRKMAVKDSIRAAKDSIVAATPRILETYAVPDSMQYRRMIMWEHDRYFNNVNLKKIDTTYNYWFHDYPFLREDVNAAWLGVSGSPVQTYDFTKRKDEKNVIFYTPYQSWSYSAETLPQYNTKTPYTELAYWGTLFANREKEESNVRILTTQNILPELNLTLEYHRFGGNGMLTNEKTDNRTAVIATNYMGRRYLMHAGYIYNKAQRNENGGIADNFWIRDTTVDSREIAVHLTDASNLTKKNTIYLDQSYRIPFSFIGKIGQKKLRKAEQARRDSIMASGDSTAIAALLSAGTLEEDAEPQADTLNTNITTAFIGHSSEYSVFTKFYKDNIGSGDENGRNFYNNRFYLNPTASADSMRVMRLENRIYLRLQPWAEDGIISKIDVGIGDKLLNYYNTTPDSYISKSANTVQNSLYLYAGARGQFRKYLKWDALGQYTFLGHELNDFGVEANVSFMAYPFRKDRNSPLILNAHFETDLDEPDHYQQQFYSNHFRWNNDFGKISTTRIAADLSIPRWKLQASFGYSILNNNIYYDTNGTVRQNSGTMSVMTASLKKNFILWKFHLDHNVLFQLSSDQDIVPLPMLALNLRYYLQFDVVKKVMQMQIGADGRYNTLWYAQAYNPVLGVFHNQDSEKYGNCPYIDVFINIQWKRACIFIKAINLNMGWPNKSTDYFSAHHYINSPMAFKFGIYWPFYIQPRRNSSVGSSATSGGGGSGALRPSR